MIRTCFRLSMYMMIAAVVQAADDPGGWTAAKWGMTDAQILQAIPAATRLDPPEKNTHAGVQIESLELSGKDFHVLFVPDSKGLLNSVLLVPAAKYEGRGLDGLFKDLEQLLVEKYGRPWITNAGKELKQTVDQWSLKTTTIILSLAWSPLAPEMQIITLQYRRKAADLDKM